MRLVYWFVEHKVNGELNIRAKTKKAALLELSGKNAEQYKKPVKLMVNYQSGFELMKMCLSNERKFWGVVK